MNDYQVLSFSISPAALALCALICVGALLAYRVLSRQWTRPGVGPSGRSRDTAALAIMTLVSLALVVYGDGYLRARAAANAQALDQLEEKTALATQIRVRITKELDAARMLLADRTLQKIVNQELVEARTELARFASFQDPKINRMIELIDTELEIRKLVSRSLSETEPAAQGAIYARLTVLAPDNDEYREKAAQYANADKAGAGTAGTPQTQGAPASPSATP